MSDDAIDPSINPSTVLYVDACVKRWEPFVKDVDADYQGRLSYLCERESNFWRDELQKPGAPVTIAGVDNKLKYVFPTLKAFNKQLALGETEFDQIAATAGAAFKSILPEPVWCLWGPRDNRPSEKEEKKFLSPLVERTHASLLAYEKIVS
jgi:hypothetical protein